MHWFDGGIGMGWMGIWWLIVIVVVVAVVWGLARGRGGRGPGGGSPEEILKSRYARGEIDSDEYERRLEDLRH